MKNGYHDPNHIKATYDILCFSYEAERPVTFYLNYYTSFLCAIIKVEGQPNLRINR